VSIKTLQCLLSENYFAHYYVLEHNICTCTIVLLIHHFIQCP